MVKRNGFVSNSSSSSFIMGIALVTKTGADFDMQLKTDPDDDKKLLGINWPLNYKWIEGSKFRLYIRSFMETEVSVEAKVGDKIIYFKGTGPDDDSNFWTGDYYDYDVELDDFNTDDVIKYKKILSYGGQVDFGAGRNG